VAQERIREWVHSLAMNVGRHGYHRIAWSCDTGGRGLQRAIAVGAQCFAP